MDLETLAQLGEFIGGIAVVISLVYLGVQMRANTRSQRADMTARVLDRLAAMQSNFASDAEVNDLFMRGLVDTSQLSLADRNRFAWIITELFGSMEFLMQQYDAGNVNQEIWERWTQTLNWWLSFPGIQAFWQGRPTPYTPAFSRYVDERIAAGPDHFNEEQWQAFLLTGKPAEPTV